MKQDNINIKYNAVTDLKSYEAVYQIRKKTRIVNWLKVLTCILLLSMFLPWTQNLRVKGYVTTQNQEDRPTQLNSIIPGKIMKWYVKEGDAIKKGDTILRIGEIKEEYFDPNLIQRTLEQIVAKERSLMGYEGKAGTAGDQMLALQKSRDIKLQQTENKIKQQRLYISIDSSNLVAGQTEIQIYTRQFNAAKTMFDGGAISLSEFEKRTATYQNAVAKIQILENKLNQSRQELLNIIVEKDNILQEYRDKILKAEGERFGSISNAASAEYEISKLKNTYANYDNRNKLYYILSPIDGQVGSINKAGIDVVLKEGDFIAEIIPQMKNKAVEIFIDPVDLPLVQTGQKMQFIFDGYPVVLFGGWPKYNYGTFHGKIAMIEKASSINGKFRALVIEDPEERQWPPYLTMGGGANGIILLKNVRIYYEIWRNINGFPPEYYVKDENISNKK